MVIGTEERRLQHLTVTQLLVASKAVSKAVSKALALFEDVHFCLSSVEKKLRFLRKTFQDVSPHNRLEAQPNQCSPN